MHSIPYQHTPVMVKEVIELLKPVAGKIFVDATLGGGGHTEAILTQPPSPSGRGDQGVRVFALDQDLAAITAAKQRLAAFESITYIHDNFSNLKAHVKEKVDGILFDLGVSSYQVDAPTRGFSLQKDGPLDMRMDQRGKLTAEMVLNNYSTDELTRIFKEYGEERFARRVSNAIGERRKAKKIGTTFELKAIIEKAIPTWKKRESVTRIFQALRIEVNGELTKLRTALEDAIELLKPGGRVIVIAYHSLEDRIVKQTFRDRAKNDILKLLTKKPLTPTIAEISQNPRASSAKLRAAEKT